MNIFPISPNTFEDNYQKKSSSSEEKYEISLPSTWWNSINSYDVISTKSPNLFINNTKKRTQDKFIYLHHKWSTSNGDYRVRMPYKRDMAYYRDIKQKFMKYSVYPFIVITGLMIYLFSILIAQIQL